MAEQRKWILTLSGDRSPAALRSALEEAGFDVDQELAEVGVITGRCGADSADRVRAIPGVADMAPDGEVDIGPPGSSDTW